MSLLAAPAVGPFRGVLWVLKAVTEQAEGELHDETKVRAELAELGLCYDLGEIGEEEFERAEEALLERLRAIRKAKEEG